MKPGYTPLNTLIFADGARVERMVSCTVYNGLITIFHTYGAIDSASPTRMLDNN